MNANHDCNFLVFVYIPDTNTLIVTFSDKKTLRLWKAAKRVGLVNRTTACLQRRGKAVVEERRKGGTIVVEEDEEVGSNNNVQQLQLLQHLKQTMPLQRRPQIQKQQHHPRLHPSPQHQNQSWRHLLRKSPRRKTKKTTWYNWVRGGGLVLVCRHTNLHTRHRRR